MTCEGCSSCRGKVSGSRVVLDTNFLLIPHENKVDIFVEIQKSLGKVEFIIPEPVMKELYLISGKNTGAKVALELLEKQEFTVIGSEYSADNAVIDIAREYGAYVASMDAKVRKRARGSYLKTICLRRKKQVVVDE